MVLYTAIFSLRMEQTFASFVVAGVYDSPALLVLLLLLVELPIARSSIGRMVIWIVTMSRGVNRPPSHVRPTSSPATVDRAVDRPTRHGVCPNYPIRCVCPNDPICCFDEHVDVHVRHVFSPLRLWRRRIVVYFPPLGTRSLLLIFLLLLILLIFIHDGAEPCVRIHTAPETWKI